MLRIATFNVNGIRATRRRGFDDWLRSRGCDVVALQEVRCPVPLLPDGSFGDYHLTYDAGQIAGRNGVAVLTREQPAAVRSWGDGVLTRAPGDSHIEITDAPLGGPLARGLKAFSSEGRYIEVDLSNAPLTIASLYLPKGGLPAALQKPGRMRERPDGGAKYARKMRFLDGFRRHLVHVRRAARAQGRELLLMGDLNVAHNENDVANWRTSRQSEGFLPEEREWIGSLQSPRTMIDVVRRLHGDVPGPYSWWSWLGNAFTNDTGWRIDYHLATPGLARTAIRGGTDREASADARLSDHAPVVVDYDFP